MQDELARTVAEWEQQLLLARSAIDGALETMRAFTSDLHRGSLADAARLQPQLGYDEATDTVTLGHRRLTLTGLENALLRLLWMSAPKPILQKAAAEALECKLGSIYTTVSILRKRLHAMSDGRDYIESVRGKGWALRLELCSRPR